MPSVIKDQALRRNLSSALSDGRISKAEADGLIHSAKDGRGVTATEKADLEKLLRTHESRFESNAKLEMQKFLGVAPPPVPTNRPPPAQVVRPKPLDMTRSLPMRGPNSVSAEPTDIARNNSELLLLQRVQRLANADGNAATISLADIDTVLSDVRYGFTPDERKVQLPALRERVEMLLRSAPASPLAAPTPGFDSTGSVNTHLPAGEYAVPGQNFTILLNSRVGQNEYVNGHANGKKTQVLAIDALGNTYSLTGPGGNFRATLPDGRKLSVSGMNALGSSWAIAVEIDGAAAAVLTLRDRIG